MDAHAGDKRYYCRMETDCMVGLKFQTLYILKKAGHHHTVVEKHLLAVSSLLTERWGQWWELQCWQWKATFLFPVSSDGFGVRPTGNVCHCQRKKPLAGQYPIIPSVATVAVVLQHNADIINGLVSILLLLYTLIIGAC